MATTVILPKQGQSVETCIITEWYKKKGDLVSEGDLLFAYETDKSSFEEEAKVSGVLLDVYFEAGDEVAVLTEVAVIGEKGEKFEAPLIQETQAEPVSAEAPQGEERVTKIKPDETLRISPRARKMAELKGISFEMIKGTGPNGRIIVRDVEGRESLPGQTITTPPEGIKVQKQAVFTPTDGDSMDKPLSNMRKLIAKSMHASLQNSAQLTHHMGADARKIISLRKKVKKLHAEGKVNNITLNDMVCFAVIRALKMHPDANAHFLGDSIRNFRKVHLGIAVDTERGLMVPVLRNADDLSLAGLSDQIARLAESCKTGKVNPDLLQPEAASFTVSNLGNYGVEMFTPVINLPQTGILGVNTILRRPTEMEDGSFGFVPYMGLSLTYDHRAIDGGPATLFLGDIKKEIENFDHDLIKL